VFRTLSSLFHRKPKRLPPLEVARADRRRAAEAYADAKERRDSRDQHIAHQRFTEATNALLRLEAGR
jgi:hypothetical protein